MLRNRDGIACKLQFAFVEWLRHERRVAKEQQMAVATNRRRRRIDGAGTTREKAVAPRIVERSEVHAVLEVSAARTK
jgi:hypothetical protein